MDDKQNNFQSEESIITKVLNVLRMTKDKDMLCQAIFALWAGNTEGMYWTTIAAQYKTPQLISICFFNAIGYILICIIYFGNCE